MGFLHSNGKQEYLKLLSNQYDKSVEEIKNDKSLDSNKKKEKFKLIRKDYLQKIKNVEDNLF
jgi:hypothetical protein